MARAVTAPQEAFRLPVWAFSSAPFRGCVIRCGIPSAHALGYYLSPLRGSFPPLMWSLVRGSFPF